MDWADDLMSDEERAALVDTACTFEPTDVGASRDALFMRMAAGAPLETLVSGAGKHVLSSLEAGAFRNSAQLYATCEFLSAVRGNEHLDLRQDAPLFFAGLPAEFLLSLKPAQVEHPDWLTHIAALALVGLDPNLEGSQYLQGWAIEDRQIARDGPGVAYELLWADPYLPGIGYQNLDPWAYDSDGRLFARTDWNANACWIAVSVNGIEQENCPPQWQKTTATFGHLLLVPFTGRCVEAPQRRPGESVILWGLRPHQTGSYVDAKQHESFQADAAGMWRLPGNVSGKICVAR
ncbi:MAG: hypothetical protein JO119_04895 [Acidobacteria bacterium]|nr:hypothetical protein [Acidobacteriota bacterium]